jgi:translocation and assembly module TamB
LFTYKVNSQYFFTMHEKSAGRLRKYTTSLLRFMARSLLYILLAVLLVLLILQFPVVQTFIAGRIAANLSKETGAVINIERLAIRIPSSVELEGVYIEDPYGDTLLHAGRIYAGLRMTSLLKSRIHINSLEIENLTAFILREAPDTVFNFQFLADAFAGDDPPGVSGNSAVPDTTSPSPVTFFLDRLRLSNIVFHFEDHFSGIQLSGNLGYLQTSLAESELLNGRYHAGDTEISETLVRLTTFEPSFPDEEPPEETQEPDIHITSLELTTFRFFLEDHEGTALQLFTSFFEIIPEHIDLAGRMVKVSSIIAEDMNFALISPADAADSRPAFPEAAGQPEEESEPGFEFSRIMDWTIGVDNLEFKNSNIRIGQENLPLAKEFFDAGNFSLNGMNLHAQNIYAAPDSLRIGLKETSMLISEVFNLAVNLEINLGINSGTIDLDIMTAKSSMEFSLATEANILNFTLNDLADSQIQIKVGNTWLDDDLSFLFPALDTVYFNRPGTGPVELSSSIGGTPARLIIDSIRIASQDLFLFLISGNVAGWPDIETLHLDLENFEFWTIPERLLLVIPDVFQAEDITLPGFMHLTGQFRGTVSEFESAILLHSDLGDISLTAAMYEENGSENHFRGRMISTSFEIGQLLQDELIQQPVSVDLVFEGRGLEPENMELTAALAIGQLKIMDYSYDDIAIHANLRDSVAFLTSGYSDEFLAFYLDAEVGILKETPGVKGQISIGYADLERLGIANENLLFGTTIDTDLIMSPADFFNGSIIISNTNVAIGEEKYTMPEMNIISWSQPGDYSLEISSGLIGAVYKGNISPVEIPNILTAHISKYFEIAGGAEYPDQTDDLEAGPATHETDAAGDDHFSLELNLFPTDITTMVLLPSVDEHDTLTLSVNYSRNNSLLAIDAGMGEITYSGIEFRNFRAIVLSDYEKMDFGISLDSINLNGAFIQGFDLSGNIVNDIIDFSLSFNDSERQEIFHVAAAVENHDGLILFRVDPENVVLNYNNWSIHPENLIIAGQQHLQFENFIMEYAGSILSITGRDPDDHDYDHITDILIRDLDIHGITGFADELLPLRGGVLNGEMTIRDIGGVTSFTADIHINNLMLSGYEIESVTLQAEDAGPDRIYLNAAVNHENTSLSLSGDYYPGEDPAVAIELAMENIDLQLIEMFAGDELTNVSGKITGLLRVEGNISDPEVSGEVNFSEVRFRIVQLNADYLIKQEQIIFDRHVARFMNFSLEDLQGRAANIDGTVDFSTMDELDLNLNFATRNFMLMNLPARRGAAYYGTILMDSDLQIRGSHTSPSIEGRLRMNEGSSFTFIVPQTSPEAIGGEGVVEFISPDEEEFHRKIIEMEGYDELRSGLEVMTVNLNIELDDNTELSVIIDEMAGDHLNLRGGGMLTFNIDPGGAINLTGRYEIVAGEYMLSFHEVARRRFTIREGSNILFTGDPMESELDITAIYTVRTNPEELMRPVGQGGQPRGERIRRQFPFLVYLNMQGELMSPEISFELDMPPEHRDALEGSVMARINAINEDESELNKQVFALLILGNFIHESPFAATGPGIGSTARNSASQILSQQLNRLSDRYVRGVDISFELESYEVDREDDVVGRTELQVEISRNFFDERVRVVVGGNIELEDETHRETRPGEVAGDFTLEYLLTPGGNLILKGFRTREYGDLIEGELTTTGVSLLYSRSYNDFRELFRRAEGPAAPPLPEEENLQQ